MGIPSQIVAWMDKNWEGELKPINPRVYYTIRKLLRLIDKSWLKVR
jgi:hypothetical protein